MKLKLYYAFFFLIFFEIAFMPVQSQSVSLTIKNWDGTDKNVDLNSLKKVTFSGANLVLNYLNGSNEDIAVSTVRKMFFGSYTDVNSILVDNKPVFIYPNPSSNYISFKNVTVSNTNAIVYNINGTQVMTINLSSGIENIDVSALKKGIYLIKIDSQVLKFTRL